MREMLLERGYGFAEVAIEPALEPATASADLTLTAQCGVAPALREIRLIGNRSTRDRILRREIPLKRGDRFHPAAIRQAQQNLLDTDLFSAVDVRYVGDARRAEFDLEVEVRERETGRAEMGFTYGTVEGAAFVIQVSEHNLALRPPWRGDALQARASALVGTEIRRIEAGLRNPRIGESYWGADLDLFDEDNRYISEVFDQRSRGFSVSASHPVGRHHALSLGYTRTFFDVYNYAAGLTPPPPEETDVDLAALALAWRYERVDDAFRPTRGVRVRQQLALGLEALGGDTEVLQYRGRAAVFLPGPRSQTLVLRLGIESVEARGSTATAPLPLRVWLGGSETLKGFAHRSVSPFDDGGIPVGGQSAWWSGAEYLVPAFSRLDVSAYFEMGEVSADAWSFAGDARAANWGIGFLVRAENFPVRFDVAVPVTVAAGDRENERGEPRFSFSAGYRF